MKKIVAYILVFALMIVVAGGMPVPVRADMTADSVLEMKTTAVSLNKGDTVEVTFHVHNLETSGFAGYLEYDTSIFGNLPVSAVTTPDYATVADAGIWDVSYNPASSYLEVKERNNAYIRLPATTNGLLLTIKFTVEKSAASTTIRLNYPQVKRNGEPIPYPGGVSVRIDNSRTKKIVLGTDPVSGNSSIAVPVKFTTNDGFTKLSLAASFDSKKLGYDSVTIEDSVKNKVSQGSYTIMNSGNKIVVEFTATEEIKTTGTLFHLNFHAINPTTSSSTNQNTSPDSTTVVLDVDSVTNKEESAFVLTGASSTVSIAGQDHILGDVNGNGKVELVDVLYIIQYYNKARTLTAVEQKAADVNKSGAVDLLDALLIMQYYNGMSQSLG